jgi:hypothetical protein
MCYYFAMQIFPTITLTHGPSSYSEMIWTQGFF